MQKHTCMPYMFVHDTLSLEAWKTTPLNKGEAPLHLGTKLDRYMTDTNRTIKGNKYPWLNKAHKI